MALRSLRTGPLATGRRGAALALVVTLATTGGVLTAAAPDDATMATSDFTIPAGDGADPDAPFSQVGQRWPIYGTAPGHIAITPWAYGVDHVVDGKTEKKVLLTYGAQDDYAWVDSVNMALTSQDSGETFTGPTRTPYMALNMVRLSDGSLLAVDFIPEFTDDSHTAVTITTWRSNDLGATWKESTGVFRAPEGERFSDSFDRGLRVSRDPIELPDGTVIAPAYTQFDSGQVRSILLETKDRGASWQLRSTVTDTAGVATNELGIAYNAEGDLVGAMRPHIGGDPLMIAFSEDDGRTWSTPEQVKLPDGTPARHILPTLLLQPNGILLLGFGRPDNQVLVSYDGTGRTWDAHHVVFAKAPGDSGNARNNGSSGNVSMVNVEANRSMYFYDTCHANGQCFPYDETYGIGAAYIEALTPGTGKIDIATKLRSGSASISGTFAKPDKKFPEQRPEGAVDGSSEPRAAAVLASKDGSAPSMVLELDATYEVDRIGLMLGSGEPSSAELALSEDGTTWSEPVVAVHGTRDRAMRYTDFEAQPARYVKITGPVGTTTRVTELEIYAADVYTFENDPVFGIPRGFTGTTSVTVTDVERGGKDSRRSLRLLDDYNDTTTRATLVVPERDHQVTSFELGSGAFTHRGQFFVGTRGRVDSTATTPWWFQVAPLAAQSKPVVSAYNGRAWVTLGTLDEPIPPREWLGTVTVDATPTQATLTIRGKSFTTTAPWGGTPTTLNGVQFSSAGVTSERMEWFVDDLRVR